MKLPQIRRGERGGFTLIELLVVLTIIAILVSLTAVAVLKFMGEGRKLETRHDIQQLSVAVEAFKTKFNAYPPSRIRLAFNTSQYTIDPPVLQAGLDADSMAFMKQMFPRAFDTWSSTTAGVGIPWLPGMGPATPPVTLEGDQCLVFFLGGQQGTQNNVNGILGFSTTPTNPCDLGTGIGPFYEFKPARLFARPNGAFAYNDPYGNPYAYFSSYKTRNGYNRYFSALANSDCATAGVWPYADPTSPGPFPNMHYLNPSTFQIISAGPPNPFGQSQFGQGTNPTAIPVPSPTWSAGNGLASGCACLQNTTTVVGQNNMSNFYDLLLGN
jgi:general secretion pathway protein G